MIASNFMFLSEDLVLEKNAEFATGSVSANKVFYQTRRAADSLAECRAPRELFGLMLNRMPSFPPCSLLHAPSMRRGCVLHSTTGQKSQRCPTGGVCFAEINK